MKHTLTTLAALLVLTVAAQSGETYYDGGASAPTSQAWRHYPLDINRDGRRARGDVCYRGLTHWNLPPAHIAADVARRSPGFIPTPAPLFSGAGTVRYNSYPNYRSGYYNAYPNYRSGYYNAYPNYRGGRYYYGY